MRYYLSSEYGKKNKRNQKKLVKNIEETNIEKAIHGLIVALRRFSRYSYNTVKTPGGFVDVKYVDNDNYYVYIVVTHGIKSDGYIHKNMEAYRILISNLIKNINANEKLLFLEGVEIKEIESKDEK